MGDQVLAEEGNVVQGLRDLVKFVGIVQPRGEPVKKNILVHRENVGVLHLTTERLRKLRQRGSDL